MGRGVRTVQRWERDLGLPVRRSVGGGGVVCADKRDLDLWLHNIPQRRNLQMKTKAPSGTSGFSENQTRRSSLSENRARVKRRSHELAVRSSQINQKARHTLALPREICNRHAERMRPAITKSAA